MVVHDTEWRARPAKEVRYEIVGEDRLRQQQSYYYVRGITYSAPCRPGGQLEGHKGQRGRGAEVRRQERQSTYLVCWFMLSIRGRPEQLPAGSVTVQSLVSTRCSLLSRHHISADTSHRDPAMAIQLST